MHGLNTLGKTARAGLAAAANTSMLAGTGFEVAWLAAHVVTYPFGVTKEQRRTEAERYTLRGLPPVHRGLIIGNVEAAGTPILLLHGIIDNRSVFSMLRRGLRRRGFGRVWTMNYNPLTYDIRTAARQLARHVEQICLETGYERVHIVGHSLGGLIARYYVQRMGGDARVHTLVTLGTPHSGTKVAHIMRYRVVQQMRPDSELLRELAEPAPGCRTRFLAYWSDLDEIIIPRANARIDHPDLFARNIFVPAVGHFAMPFRGHVVHDICTALAHLDHDGTTVTPGVTRLPVIEPLLDSPGVERRPTDDERTALDALGHPARRGRHQTSR